MLLKNLFLKTLRDNRRSVLIWGSGLALILVGTGASYESIFGAPGPERIKLAQQYKDLAKSFSFLTGEMYDVETYGGYLTARMSGILVVLFSIFALFAGSGIIRGEEEKNSLDLLLSTPHSRLSVLLQKWAGMAVSLLGIVLLTWLGIILGAAAGKQEINAGAAFLAVLDAGLVGLLFGTLALLLGQFMSRKAAAGWTGGILAATYLLNNLSASASSLQWIRYFTPSYYESLSKPLAKSVGVNWLTLPVLTAITLLLLAVTIPAYLGRDQNNYFRLGGIHPVIKARTAREISEPNSIWLTNSFFFGLRSALPGVLIWGIGIAAYTFLIMSVMNTVRSDAFGSFLQNDIYKSLGFVALTTNENLLSLLLFVFAILLFAAYAVTLVSGWSSEENEGRLELILSAPLPRWRMLLGRFLVALISSALVVLIVAGAFALGAQLNNLTINFDKAFGAFFGLWVVCVIIAAAGYLLSAFGPTQAVAITGGLVVVSYFLDLFGPVFKLPGWTQNLSIFHLYGRPITNGLDWSLQFLLLTVSAAFVALAAFRFWQRDIVK